jgi:hypothetical protein
VLLSTVTEPFHLLRSEGCLSAGWAHALLTTTTVGSFGDLGTFIPLFVAMGREGAGGVGVSARSIYVAPALFWAGLSNVATGWYWDLPLPVQPMKSICAVALVGELDRVQVSAAGVWMVRESHCAMPLPCLFVQREPLRPTCLTIVVARS